jgi:hypothetical protein
MGGGSGGGGNTQQQNQYSSISPWAQPYITSMLGAGQSQVFNTDASGQITGINPYNAFGTQNTQTGGQYGLTPSDIMGAQSSVAGFSPLQQQSFNSAANLGVPSQYNQAQGMTTGAGMASMGLGNAAASMAGQGFGAGQNYQNMATNPNAMQAYMNPYVQASLQPQLNLLGQQTGINSAAEQAAATRSGAYGGTRSALQSALTQQAGDLAAQQAIGQGYNQAFNQAQQAQQFGANLGLQGLQSGLGALQTGMQGYGQGLNAANQLAGIGTQNLAAQQGILGTQNQLGAQQQTNQQNVINQAMQNYSTGQQYPMQQLMNLKSLALGIPMTDTTTTQAQAAPSGASTLAGLGTMGIAGLGMYNAMNPGAKP